MDIKACIDRATETQRKLQNANGAWPGRTYGGADSMAIWLITHRLIIDNNHDLFSQAVAHFRDVQQSDGSFLPYPGATQGNLRTSSIVYGCLAQSGINLNDPLAVNLSKYIQKQGGFSSLDPQALAFLAIAGVIPKNQFSAPSVIYRVIPGLDWFIGRRFSEFSSLAINTLPPTLVGICDGVGSFNKWYRPLKMWAGHRFVRYFRAHQNPLSGWGGVMESTCWVVIALHYLGLDKVDPLIQQGLKRLEHWLESTEAGVQVMPFQAEVWNTALMVRARLFQGYDCNDPAVRQGIEYLLSEQGILVEQKDWQNPQPSAPRIGGWAFQEGNPQGLDADSSGAVLFTLALAEISNRDSTNPIPKLSDALTLGKNWFFGMQNPDGGWASFAWGQQEKTAGPLDYSSLAVPDGLIAKIKYLIWPPVEVADPSIEDETGRILSALCGMGLSKDSSKVQSAVSFLKSMVGPNGVWWGRWEVNYLTSTSYILNGLGDVGESPDQDWIKNAVNWVLSKQNDDGGWGETASSYSNVEIAGIGPSNPITTGKVLTSLISINRNNLEGVLPVIDRGIEYLLALESEGYWQTDFAVGVVLPPDVLYANPVFAQYVCLEALLNYHRFVQGINE